MMQQDISEVVAAIETEKLRMGRCEERYRETAPKHLRPSGWFAEAIRWATLALALWLLFGTHGEDAGLLRAIGVCIVAFKAYQFGSWIAYKDGFTAGYLSGRRDTAAEIYGQVIDEADEAEDVPG